jgi:hypothetical protein
MAQIELRSRGVKGACIICNGAPVDETREDRRQLPMFHAVGVDVNWGEDCNICQVCAGIMADMLGRPDELKVKRLSKAHEDLSEKYEEMASTFEDYRGKVKNLIYGKKAQKELKAMDEEINKKEA